MARRKGTSLDAIIEREEKGTYRRLDKIIAKLMGHLESARETFIEYCKAAQEEGLDLKEAWAYMRKKLQGTIPTSTLQYWGTAYLPQGTKRKNTRYHNAELPNLESHESERSTSEEQSDEDDYGDPIEIWQIPPEEYNITEVERYDRAFLIKLVRYLHQRLESTTTTTAAAAKPQPETKKSRGRPKKKQ